MEKSYKQKRKNKRIKRLELLILLSKDQDWYKKENELVHAIQRKVKELSFPEQHAHLDLTINNYKKLYERRIPIKDMHRYFGISSGSFLYWRKENGLMKENKKQQEIISEKGVFSEKSY